MANDAFFKPSLQLDKFLPEDYSLDTERFLLFLRAYYEWLQTTKVTLTGVTGTFLRDEIVTGAGGATGIVVEVGTGYIVIKVTSRLAFNRKETITGQTSSATATISTIKDNAIRASGNLPNYRNFELSLDTYIDYLREELFPSLPRDYNGDKRLLATKFKQFLESKSNEESYRFLFKLIYNEDVEFYYPGEDVLRVSDGNFEKTQIIRVQVTSDIFEFLNKTIRGETSGALGNVVDIKTYFVGSTNIAEMTLKLVSGTFAGDEEIVDINDETLTATTYGMVTGFIINDGGSGYQPGNTISISGDGSGASAVVLSVEDSPITTLKVNTVGHGYRLNTNATINNAGTGGSNLLIRVTELTNTYTVTSGANNYTVGEISQVSVINRGSGYFKSPTITIEDTTISALGLLSAELITIANTGNNYGVGNTLVFTGGAGANAAGQVASVVEGTTYDLLFEDGFRMQSEDSFYDIIKNEDWSVVGPIARIELTNFGDGYTSANLPSITVTTTTGSGANLVATNIQGKSANVQVDVANNSTGIGSIRALEIRNFGVDYTTATANASATGDGNANLTPIISGLGIKEGFWVNDDGKIDYKYLQDSYFYQDFSYVVKSGIAFSTYSNTLKKIIHPAGIQPFGQILISNTLDLSPQILSSDVISEVEEYILHIESFFTMGIADASSRIYREIEVQSEGANVSTDLLSEKEYTIILPPIAQSVSTEGTLSEFNLEIRNDLDDQISTEVSTTLFLPENILGLDFLSASSKISRNVEMEFNAGFESIDKTYEINVNLAGSSAVSIEMEILSSGNQSEIIQYIVSYVEAFPAYGIRYGDLKILGRGVYDEDWRNTPISDWQNFRFNDLYQTFNSTQLPVTIQRSTLIDNGSVVEVATLEVKTQSTTQVEATVQSKIPRIIESASNFDPFTIQTETSRFVKNNLNASSVLGTMSYNVEIENVIEDQFTIDAPIFRVIESFNDSNALFFEETTNKYKEIVGTVSFNAGGQYKDLQILGFANVTIGAVSSSTFETPLPLVTGTGTSFLVDYSISDVFVANNEYFVITNIFSNTTLTIDRPPASSFTNVVAYKII